VLASDAAHYYANLQKRSPFPIVYNVGDMAQGWKSSSASPAIPTVSFPAMIDRQRDLSAPPVTRSTRSRCIAASRSFVK